MKTIKTEVYQFAELSETAKEKAIINCININLQDGWWESTYEDAKNIGLCLSSFDIDRNRNAQGEFLLAANEVAANIFKGHGENCTTWVTANNFMNEWQPIFDSYMDENSENYESSEYENILQELENDFLNSLLEDYSILLQKEYEYLYSDEAIIETIEANEYYFLEDGSKY